MGSNNLDKLLSKVEHDFTKITLAEGGKLSSEDQDKLFDYFMEKHYNQLHEAIETFLEGLFLSEESGVKYLAVYYNPDIPNFVIYHPDLSDVNYIGDIDMVRAYVSMALFDNGISNYAFVFSEEMFYDANFMLESDSETSDSYIGLSNSLFNSILIHSFLKEIDYQDYLSEKNSSNYLSNIEKNSMINTLNSRL